MSELKPCPICKKQPVLSQVEGYPMQYKFFCGTHVSVGDWFPNTLGAELDWNRRTTDLTQPDFYKPTNADRIRGMSDEEHARFLARVVSDGCPPDMDWDCRKDADGWDACDRCWTRWLRQPAEE
ncbi:MAG: hypothetical protein WCT05_15685 [Lentisphaeria bacterium]